MLQKIGEPFGYRQIGEESSMVFIRYEEAYVFFLLGDYRQEKAGRLDLRFTQGVLADATISREGMGRGINLDDFVYRSYLF